MRSVYVFNKTRAHSCSLLEVHKVYFDRDTAFRAEEDGACWCWKRIVQESRKSVGFGIEGEASFLA